jgi:hypothetical protein
MSKHTPGPWKAIKSADHGYAITKAELNIERELAFVMLNEANAHLIAAAPEMYEALKAIMDCIPSIAQNNLPIWQRANAALAKAEGRE